MKKLFIVFIAVLFVLPAFALAADFKVSQESDNVSIASSEQVKNLYTAGANVTSDANVLGDMVVAGGYVTVNGKVQQGLMLVAGNILVSGDVGQNVRVAGGNVQITGNVGQDLLVAGGTVDIGDKSTISGDFLSASGTSTISGNILGNVKLAGGSVTINGRINGDVTIYDAQSVELGSNAYIGGDFKYEAPQSATIASTAKVVGATEFSPTTPVNFTALAGLMAFATIAKWLGVLSAFILALLVAYLLTKFAKYMVGKSFEKPWASFGWGMLVLIVSPIALLILLASILGLSVGILLGVTLGAVMVFAKPLGALVLGAWIVRLFSKGKELRVDWLTALIGVLLVAVLSVVPVVGWIIPFFTYMVALGVLVEWTWNWAKRNR